MTARSIANKHSILTVTLLGACAALAAACSTSDPTTAKGNTAGAAGAAGSSTAGASGAGTAGAAGAGTAGAAGAGTAGAGTAGGGTGVACLPIATGGLITDFSPTDGGSATQQNFGDLSTMLTGSTFVYPNPAATPTPMYPLTSDVSGGNWHITGAVGDYSGFGFALQVQVGAMTTGCNKIDASAYSGISFTLSGSVPMGNAIQLNVGTAGDALADSWFNQLSGVTAQTTFGRCVPAGAPTVAGTTQYSQPDCKDPIYAITVPATPTTITVHWTDMMGGKPEVSPNPAELTYLSFNFPPPANPGQPTAVTYPIDIIVDDLKFIP